MYTAKDMGKEKLKTRDYHLIIVRIAHLIIFIINISYNYMNYEEREREKRVKRRGERASKIRRLEEHISARWPASSGR